MKKTNEELLEFFGLKVGDKVKIEGYDKPFVIFEKSGIQYVEEMSKDRICSTWDIIDFIRALLRTEYEVIAPKKKVGELICDKIFCIKCPLRAIDCEKLSITLYEALEKYLNNFNSFNSSLKPFEKAFIDALKAELDKDVEEE